MSLNAVITALGAQTYTVTRTSAGAYDIHGRYTPGGVTTFSIVASTPTPTTGRQLRDLAEGQRGDESLQVFTAVELRTRTPANEPDVLTFGGEAWTVTKVQRWDGLGEVHYECTISRAPPPRGTVP